ncbi:heart- and neural crest derivatives-expressed protein 2-like isoform X2 [Biomphalaria glabrata]|uniref:Heart- and neural crest derivatives-expressed protein 2-like isoform X2 n=1 Tax=Biomphalaria glabrata TaxID=6526 RepID=A0A9W3B651_BIOGL|nr:heart- and neural crest derivatives-expressed protein 2-like isoform X2 [Biomphalaria glabrata]
MSLTVGGYPQSYPHHPHPHQTHHYHHGHHPLPNGGGAAVTGGGMSSPAAPHEFYPTYPHHQMARYPEHPDTTAAAVAGGYFPNWMLSPPPELTTVTGHIPDGYHSFGAPGANSPGGTHYQSFIQYENGVPVRCIKRRVTANKKERRRTLSINNAFAQLRGCIPNVPSDTKLSKIKTLRLATSYISYLMDILAKDDPELSRTGFKAELTKKVTTNQSMVSSAQGLTNNGGLTSTVNLTNLKPDVCVSSALTHARTLLDRGEDKRKRWRE